MVGDGLYTDVLGGLAAGLGTVLVTDHGLLKGLDWQAWTARPESSPITWFPRPEHVGIPLSGSRHRTGERSMIDPAAGQAG